VLDVAMVDGSAILMTMMWGLKQIGFWDEELGVNVLDTGAPFYDTYETADGKFVALGSLEPQFYAELLRILELDPADVPQMDRDRWPELKQRFASVFRGKTRAEWTELLEHAEACATPVLSMAEASSHPHNRARGAFVEIDGITQPAPAPRFSRTAPEIRMPAREPGADTDQALAAWGVPAAEIEALRSAGAVG
jgi:alpha-methylacyl-CoA racemase